MNYLSYRVFSVVPSSSYTLPHPSTPLSLPPHPSTPLHIPPPPLASLHPPPPPSTGPVQHPRTPAAAMPQTPLPLPWGKGCAGWTLGRGWPSMLALLESVPSSSLPGYSIVYCIDCFVTFLPGLLSFPGLASQVSCLSLAWPPRSPVFPWPPRSPVFPWKN